MVSGSCVVGADYDQDGDIDLFVGGRLSPLAYPMPGESLLLENSQGRFTDVSQHRAPGLKQVGMVTDALWTDYDGDGDADLMVVGEFMPIMLFENHNGKLVNISDSTVLGKASGWWHSIHGGDFDSDGDTDYILGNLGLNNPYRATLQTPVTVNAADYDQNGYLDPVLGYFIGDVAYPAHSRDALINQVPAMKKHFPDYASYAQTTLTSLIQKFGHTPAITLSANHFATSYVENLGNGQFKITPLPIEAQLAPVRGIIIEDLNNDSHLDLLLTGNDYGPEPGIGQYDAALGLVLLNNGNGQFNALTPQQSGLFLNGDMRGASRMKLGEKPAYLIAQNNGAVFGFQYMNAPYNQKWYLPPANAFKAIAVLKNGRQQVHEFYFGASYLSQQSRALSLPVGIQSLTVYGFRGDTIDFKTVF